MPDRVTANLPSRQFAVTAQFYAQLGFAVAYQGPDWMILRRGDLEIEFFAHPELDPGTSWHSACVRVDDLDALHAAWAAAGLPHAGIPRITPLERLAVGLRMFCIIDPDGSLLRCLGPE